MGARPPAPYRLLQIGHGSADEEEAMDSGTRNGSRAQWLAAAILGSALAVVTGCDDANDPVSGGGPTGGGLVISEAQPPEGNGTLANPTITYETDQGPDHLDVVRLSETVGDEGHELEFYWVPATAEVRSVQHAFGPAAGGAATLTGCCTGAGCSPCDPSKISVDTANRVITAAGLVLPDMFGGTGTSRVDGTVHW